MTNPGTLARAAAAALAALHCGASLAHGGHGAPLAHLHGAEIIAAAFVAILAGAAACWAVARREARARR